MPDENELIVASATGVNVMVVWVEAAPAGGKVERTGAAIARSETNIVNMTILFSS